MWTIKSRATYVIVIKQAILGLPTLLLLLLLLLLAATTASTIVKYGKNR